MTHEQALEVLKEHRDILLTTAEFTKALNIAIAIMEGKKEDIMKAFDAGYASGYIHLIDDGEQYYNSLTKTETK